MAAAALAWRRARGVARYLALAGNGGRRGSSPIQTDAGHLHDLDEDKAADVATAHVAVGAIVVRLGGAGVRGVASLGAPGYRGGISRIQLFPAPRAGNRPRLHEIRRPHRTGSAHRRTGGLPLPPSHGHAGSSPDELAHPPGLFGDLCELVKARLNTLMLVTTLAGFLHGLARADGLGAAFQHAVWAPRWSRGARRRSTNSSSAMPDAAMNRTRARPLPAGRMSARTRRCSSALRFRGDGAALPLLWLRQPPGGVAGGVDDGQRTSSRTRRSSA